MTKKRVYHLLTSISLLGGLVGQSLVYPQVVQANQFSAQKGTFTVGGSVLNVRSEPSTGAEVVGQYQPGQNINYDQIGTSNGYRWISYVGGSGNRRYVAIGTADGSASYGQLAGSVNAPTTPSKPQASSALDSMRQGFLNGDFSALAGQWKNGKGEVITVTSDGKMTYASRPSDPHQLQRSSHYNEQEPEGEVHFGVRVNAMAGHYAGRYAPAGTAFAPGLGTGEVDDSDTSRERLIFGQGRQLSNKAETYYRVEESADKKPDSQEEAKQVLPKLTGTWKNAKGDLVTISADGTFSGKTLFDEKTNEAITPVVSNFSGLSNYQVANTGFYYDPKQDAILIYTHSDYQPTPGHEHFYTRVKTEESQSSSSAKDTTAAAKKEASKGTVAEETVEETGNLLQKLYQQLTNRKDLPSTGEAVSVLGLIGAGLATLVIVLKKRFTRKN